MCCRYAVVTGANRGMGLEICRRLASNGVMVVLTARDEKKGIEALEKLKENGLSDLVVFHQLDVLDPSTIASLADFIQTQFGRLDILVNNAAIGAITFDTEALKASAGYFFLSSFYLIHQGSLTFPPLLGSYSSGLIVAVRPWFFDYN
ncbi:hypothetical protein HYC85_009250 [Camellia sinensis]|uniref:(+)-neomenthol dehydrogenase-like n=1 Tax=Camellia sinensis TaxID=4442 RepID=A0A7J7HHD0_CAMSI|nr:hypothetical protein HYC85_009250 [Camellia sinensis]